MCSYRYTSPASDSILHGRQDKTERAMRRKGKTQFRVIPAPHEAFVTSLQSSSSCLCQAWIKYLSLSSLSLHALLSLSAGCDNNYAWFPAIISPEKRATTSSTPWKVHGTLCRLLPIICTEIPSGNHNSWPSVLMTLYAFILLSSSTFLRDWTKWQEIHQKQKSPAKPTWFQEVFRHRTSSST